DEQLDLELAFEVPDLLAQGRLGSAQPARRMPEVKLFGNRDKIPKMTELHDTFLIAGASRPERYKGLDRAMPMKHAGKSEHEVSRIEALAAVPPVHILQLTEGRKHEEKGSRL